MFPNLIIKGEGMKTFRIAQLLAVATLFVVGSALATNCCEPKQCERTCSTCPAVKIPGEEVEYQKIVKESCGNPGSVKYFVTKEYVPCSMEDKERVQCLRGCPKYLGTFDEDTGAPLDEIAARNCNQSTNNQQAAPRAKRTRTRRAAIVNNNTANDAAAVANDTMMIK